MNDHLDPDAAASPPAPDAAASDGPVIDADTDARVRSAFGDLAARSAFARPAASSAAATADRRRRLAVPALAAAVVAAVVGSSLALVVNGDGDGGELEATGEATTVSVDTADAATGGDAGAGGPADADLDGLTPDDADGAAATEPGEVPGPGEPGARYRVATDVVAADAGDPFLNLRADPDPASDLVAALPPTYRGLRATGQTASADDGGQWLEVELLDPVALAVAPPGDGSNPTGWVNSGFVIALADGLAVGVDEVPACAGGTTGTVGSAGGTWSVRSLESGLVADGCLRTVVGFESGAAAFTWSDVAAGSAPADGLPRLFPTMSGGSGLAVDLGSVDSVWPGATETGAGVYVVRDAADTLDLLAPRPTQSTHLTALPDAGLLVIDVTLGGTAPPAGGGVVLTQEPLIGDDHIEVVGISRPFEATVDVRVLDADGRSVSAVYAGHRSLGTIESDAGYGVDTNDWTTAWGTFALRVTVAPGDYTLVLSGDGASDNPATLRLPFTTTAEPDVDVVGAEPQAAAQSLQSFADGGPYAALPLADTVTLGLGPTEVRTVGAADLADRSAWTIESDGFAGFDGPFNALDVLAGGRFELTSGATPHCAGPPRTWPEAWAGLDQVNLVSIGIDSCIAWSGVHVFLDDDGAIAAITLDLFGP